MFSRLPHHSSYSPLVPSYDPLAPSSAPHQCLPALVHLNFQFPLLLSSLLHSIVQLTPLLKSCNLPETPQDIESMTSILEVNHHSSAAISSSSYSSSSASYHHHYHHHHHHHHHHLFSAIRPFLQQTRATPVTKDLWENLILNSETPVLVEFYANWCGPCKMVHRVMDEIEIEYAGKLKCFKVNTDTDMEIADDYEIKAVPVVLLFKNGKKCDSVIGTMPKEFYVAAIERVLKS